MACSACKQFGGTRRNKRTKRNTRNKRYRGGATSTAPLSYVNNSYREPSGYAGSNVLISEPGLARPALQHTGGRRSRKGGFYPSVMGPFINNAIRLAPASAITAYRMTRNYRSSSKTRKNRK
jgi:hypothetical protein